MSLFCDKCNTESPPDAESCPACNGPLIELFDEKPTLSNNSLLDNRYEIINQIASGGMGTVYKANDLRLERVCAVKEMLCFYKKKEQEEYAIKRFKDEAMILAKLKHDNLPAMYDYFVFNRKYYLIMEYIEGETLENILERLGRPGLPENEVVKWGVEILDVLAYLHEQDPPIVYRDIKPSNIIVRNTDKRAMLIDFGIARAVRNLDTQKTAIGTEGYTPIEQYRGEVEPRSDVYALGATMHHLLTGLAPIPFQFEPPRELIPHISEKLDKIVMKSLQMEPKDRYKSAREMIDALTKGEEEKSRTTKIIEGSKKGHDNQKTLHPTIINPKDESTMILIPEGKFIMGNNEGAEDEKPEREVYLSPYYIDKYPITNIQFERFVQETGYEAKLDWKSYYKANTGKHPVINITWNDARQYAEWSGKRLPTEAEWEKAARGTDKRKYPWGNIYQKNHCNNFDLDVKHLLEQMAKLIEKEEKYLSIFKRKTFRGTIPVGSFPDGASPYGVMDMLGNVFEWCSDWYDHDYYNYGACEDPVGPEETEDRSFIKGKVIRGGSWNKGTYTLCTRASKGSKDILPIEWGFRCVKDI